MIDQTTAEGKALQAEVKLELRNYLGKDYSDDVLPLYIVVMLAHGNQQPLVAENLEAFLGEEKAVAFADWLFKHLEANPGKYEAPAKETTKDASAPAEAPPTKEAEDLQIGIEEQATGKRRREKREKIEWKAEPAAKTSRHRDREERRDEKRHRAGDYEERPRSDRHERERERMKDRDRDRERELTGRRASETRRSRHDESLDRDRYGSRSDRHSRHRDRELEQHGNVAELEEEGHRRKEKHSRHHEDPRADRERPSRPSSHIDHRPHEASARRSPAPGSPQEARPEAKPSVFDRLEKAPAAERDSSSLRQKVPGSRSKMRMDAIPSSKPETVEQLHDSDPEEPSTAKLLAPSASLGAQDEVAAELRQIRETLAKMQAEKARQINTVVASANVRKIVVQNVHFNATPDILRAHFGGCGAIVSSIIEKDQAGNPKGVAVIEFEDEVGRRTALTLSGSMLLGRPVTVFAKEAVPAQPASSFAPRAAAFRGRAPAPGRGVSRAPARGRSSYFPARPTLKSNKYVRPQVGENGGGTQAANGSAVGT